MKETLQQKCDQLVANETNIRKAGFLESPSLVKLGALLYLNAGATPNTEHIKACRKILKSRAGIFSNFRGTVGFVVPIKMSLAEDPEAYIDDAMYIYQGLTKGTLFSGEMMAMAAMAIKDMCPAERYDEVIAATRETYARMRKAHPFLTNEYDMVLIALLCIIGEDFDDMAARGEDIFRELRACGMPGDAAQASSMVLALSDKETTQKVAEFVELYQALKETKHATPRNSGIAIYAPFVDLNLDRDEIVADISEVDNWLKRQKGYGSVLGTGSTIRRVFAAALVLKDLQGRLGDESTMAATFAVTESVVEQVVIVVAMIILVSVISASVSSNH